MYKVLSTISSFQMESNIMIKSTLKLEFSCRQSSLNNLQFSNGIQYNDKVHLETGVHFETGVYFETEVHFEYAVHFKTWVVL